MLHKIWQNVIINSGFAKILYIFVFKSYPEEFMQSVVRTTAQNVKASFSAPGAK